MPLPKPRRRSFSPLRRTRTLRKWIFALAVIGTFMSLLTIGGNVLVLVSFFVDRQIRQPTNYFLFSLAISDFLIGCISMPFLTLALYKNQWVLGSFLCDIWLSLDYTVCLASIYTVLLITVDRFCSVKIPTKYRNWRTEKRVIFLVAVDLVRASIDLFSFQPWAIHSIRRSPIWVSLIFNASKFDWGRTTTSERMCLVGSSSVQWNKNAYFNLGRWMSGGERKDPICSSLGLTIGYFWVTLLVMFILYVFIYRVARALEQRSRANAQKFTKSMGNSSSLTSKSNRRPAALRSSSLCLRTKRRNKNKNNNHQTEYWRRCGKFIS